MPPAKPPSISSSRPGAAKNVDAVGAANNSSQRRVTAIGGGGGVASSSRNLPTRATSAGNVMAIQDDSDDGDKDDAQTPLLAFNNDLEGSGRRRASQQPRSSRRARDDSPDSYSSSDYDDVFMPYQRKPWSISGMRRRFNLWYRSSVQPHMRSYIVAMGIRAIQLAIITGALMGLLISLKYSDLKPRREDISNLKFNWTWNPSSYLRPFDADFEYNVVLDAHMHTVYSDGVMRPEQVIEWSLAHGYNAIVVADHNTIKGALKTIKVAQERYNESIVVIPGQEYSCCRIHMNFIGVNETIAPNSSWPTDEELKSVIAKVHDLGGIVSVNHIPWSNSTEWNYQVPTLQDHPSREQLVEWGVDAFEVINGGTFDLSTLQFVRENNLTALTGSDIHHPSVPANGWTLLNIESNQTLPSVADILTNLKSNKSSSFFFDATGSRPRSYPTPNPAWSKWAPLVEPDYFGFIYSEQRGMYSFVDGFCHERSFRIRYGATTWMVVWIVVAWLIYEIARVILVLAYSQFWRKQRRGSRLRL